MRGEYMPPDINPEEMEGATQTNTIEPNMIPKPKEMKLDEMLKRRAQQAQIYRNFFPDWDKFSAETRRAIHIANLTTHAPTKGHLPTIDWVAKHDYDYLDVQRRPVRSLNGADMPPGV